MFFLKYFSAIVLAVTLSICVKAEKHTVRFENNCGRGIPTLVQNGRILSKGEPYESNGSLLSAIAYLQTGDCKLNGEGCTLVETTLINPSPKTPGSGSSTDISLITPHAFSVSARFRYFNGCDGGAECAGAGCSAAFRNPDQTFVQVACQAADVGLIITFC